MFFPTQRAFPAACPTAPRRPFRWSLLIGFCLLAAACSEAPRFNATDITGADWGRDFSLADHSGTPRSLADYRGKAVALFFGYTHCPDVCPTNLAALANVMKLLGADADRVQVLFVTVDPARDTRELLAKYVPWFDPRFVGLSGDAAATAAVARDFKVFYTAQPPDAHGNYAVDHTASTYLFDPQGRLRLLVQHGESAERIAADIRLLLMGK